MQNQLSTKYEFNPFLFFAGMISCGFLLGFISTTSYFEQQFPLLKLIVAGFSTVLVLYGLRRSQMQLHSHIVLFSFLCLFKVLFVTELFELLAIENFALAIVVLVSCQLLCMLIFTSCEDDLYASLIVTTFSFGSLSAAPVFFELFTVVAILLLIAFLLRQLKTDSSILFTMLATLLPTGFLIVDSVALSDTWTLLVSVVVAMGCVGLFYYTHKEYVNQTQLLIAGSMIVCMSIMTAGLFALLHISMQLISSYRWLFLHLFSIPYWVVVLVELADSLQDEAISIRLPLAFVILLVLAYVQHQITKREEPQLCTDASSNN